MGEATAICPRGSRCCQNGIDNGEVFGTQHNLHSSSMSSCGSAAVEEKLFPLLENKPEAANTFASGQADKQRSRKKNKLQRTREKYSVIFAEYAGSEKLELLVSDVEAEKDMKPHHPSSRTVDVQQQQHCDLMQIPLHRPADAGFGALNIVSPEAALTRHMAQVDANTEATSSEAATTSSAGSAAEKHVNNQKCILSQPQSRGDPASIITFADLGLNKALLRSIRVMGLSLPSPVQCATVPRAIQGKNLIVQAKSGTGKTIAFALSLLQLLISRFRRWHAFYLDKQKEANGGAGSAPAAVRIKDNFLVQECAEGNIEISQKLECELQKQRLREGKHERLSSLSGEEKENLQQQAGSYYAAEQPQHQLHTTKNVMDLQLRQCRREGEERLEERRILEAEMTQNFLPSGDGQQQRSCEVSHWKQKGYEQQQPQTCGGLQWNQKKSEQQKHQEEEERQLGSAEVRSELVQPKEEETRRISQEERNWGRQVCDETQDPCMKADQECVAAALILTPTRELAIQVAEEFRRLAWFMQEPRLRYACLFGGRRICACQQQLYQRPHILISTPGRLLSLLRNKVLQQAAALWPCCSNSSTYHHLNSEISNEGSAEAKTLPDLSNVPCPDNSTAAGYHYMNSGFSFGNVHIDNKIFEGIPKAHGTEPFNLEHSADPGQSCGTPLQSLPRAHRCRKKSSKRLLLLTRHIQRHLQTVVLDEADMLLDHFFRLQLQKLIMDLLQPYTQMMAFSATMPPYCISFLEDLCRTADAKNVKQMEERREDEHAAANAHGCESNSHAVKQSKECTEIDSGTTDNRFSFGATEVNAFVAAHAAAAAASRSVAVLKYMSGFCEVDSKRPANEQFRHVDQNVLNTPDISNLSDTSPYSYTQHHAVHEEMQAACERPHLQVQRLSANLNSPVKRRNFERIHLCSSFTVHTEREFSSHLIAKAVASGLGRGTAGAAESGTGQAELQTPVIECCPHNDEHDKRTSISQLLLHEHEPSSLVRHEGEHLSEQNSPLFCNEMPNAAFFRSEDERGTNRTNARFFDGDSLERGSCKSSLSEGMVGDTFLRKSPSSGCFLLVGDNCTAKANSAGGSEAVKSEEVGDMNAKVNNSKKAGGAAMQSVIETGSDAQGSGTRTAAPVPLLSGLKYALLVLPDEPSLMRQLGAKVKALRQVLTNVAFRQAIVFCNSPDIGAQVAECLSQLGVPALYTSSKVSQETRLRNLLALKRIQCRVLVCSDVISRGIDAAAVDLVVNLDIPKDQQTLLHRSGRAGRFGGRGVCVSIAFEEERLTFQYLSSALKIPSNRHIDLLIAQQHWQQQKPQLCTSNVDSRAFLSIQKQPAAVQCCPAGILDKDARKLHSLQAGYGPLLIKSTQWSTRADLPFLQRNEFTVFPPKHEKLNNISECIPKVLYKQTQAGATGNTQDRCACGRNPSTLDLALDNSDHEFRLRRLPCSFLVLPVGETSSEIANLEDYESSGPVWCPTARRGFAAHLKFCAQRNRYAEMCGLHCAAVALAGIPNHSLAGNDGVLSKLSEDFTAEHCVHDDHRRCCLAPFHVPVFFWSNTLRLTANTHRQSSLPTCTIADKALLELKHSLLFI